MYMGNRARVSGLYRLCERAFSRSPRGRMGFVIYRYFSAGSKAVRINSVFFFVFLLGRCLFLRKCLQTSVSTNYRRNLNSLFFFFFFFSFYRVYFWTHTKITTRFSMNVDFNAIFVGKYQIKKKYVSFRSFLKKNTTEL